MRPMLGEDVADALTDLGQYDVVVVANRATVRALSGLVDVLMTTCPGENVLYAATSEKSVAPPFHVISGKYIIHDIFSTDG